MEAHENYQKQSWRNRCHIATANGVEALQVSVVHVGGSLRHPICETLVDYSKGFLERHQRAIDSAYRSSAYFDYYRDELYAIMNARPERLWDLDWQIMEFLAGKFNLPIPGVTAAYEGINLDLSPKRPDPVYESRPYYQVFMQKHGFLENMSAMDLLFNEGPSGIDYL